MADIGLALLHTGEPLPKEQWLAQHQGEATPGPGAEAQQLANKAGQYGNTALGYLYAIPKGTKEAGIEPYLHIETLDDIEPLDGQFDVHPPKTVPDALSDATLQANENSAYTAGGVFGGGRAEQAAIPGVLTALDNSAQTAFSARSPTVYPVNSGDMLSGIAAKNGLTLKELLNANPSKAANPNYIQVGEKINIPVRVPRSGAYQLYWYVPNNPSQILGSVINIGASPAFGFMPDSATARSSMAHELGHSLGLHHPGGCVRKNASGQCVALGMNPAAVNQFAPHNHQTINQPITPKAATNTEPPIPATVASWNVLANDPTNLMGYWGNRPDRRLLRYHQWITVSRS